MLCAAFVFFAGACKYTRMSFKQKHHPGFPNDEVRTVGGDPRQGVVLLVLLSGCAPGCGGTALVPGSHLSVLAELEAADARRRSTADAGRRTRRGSAKAPRTDDEPSSAAAAPEAVAAAATEDAQPSEPLEAAVSDARSPGRAEPAETLGTDEKDEAAWSHQALNTAFVQRLRALTDAGRVLLDCSACRGRHPHCQGNATPGGRATPGGGVAAVDAAAQLTAATVHRVSPAGSSEMPASALGVDSASCTGPPAVRVAQVSGQAGDVVLLHPLLLHAGTMNCGHAPRCKKKKLLGACYPGVLFLFATRPREYFIIPRSFFLL